MKPNRRLLFVAVAVALAAAPACGSPALPPAPPPPSTATLLDWALGADERGDYPDTADAFLLLLPQGKPLDTATRLTPACMDATSVLPGPLGDPRIFLLIDGALHVLPRQGQTPLPLAGNDTSVRLTRLLAFRAASSPLQILATVQTQGGSEEQTWILTVSEDALLRVEHLTDDRKPRTVEEFFATYTSPRCLPGGEQCVVLTQDGVHRYIDVQANRKASTEKLQTFDITADLRDVARVPGQPASFYLLLGGCT